MYVVLEGIDTCGKTTQIQALKDIFAKAIFTKEPANAQIRQFIMQEKGLCKEAEFFLFMADRAQHLHDVLKPNKERLIISDRSLISGVAYAEFQGALHINFVCMQEYLPDICIILKLHKKALIERLSSKANDRIEERGIDYLLAIQERIIAYAYSIAKCTYILDATKDRTELTDYIVRAIKQEQTR